MTKLIWRRSKDYLTPRFKRPVSAPPCPPQPRCALRRWPQDSLTGLSHPDIALFFQPIRNHPLFSLEETHYITSDNKRILLPLAFPPTSTQTHHQSNPTQPNPITVFPMSSNVGLTTPRGSGTSGYVQRNLSSLRPPSQNIRTNSDRSYETAARPRQPDAEILAHDRKREVEVKVFALQDRLEDEG